MTYNKIEYSADYFCTKWFKNPNLTGVGYDYPNVGKCPNCGGALEALTARYFRNHLTGEVIKVALTSPDVMCSECGYIEWENNHDDVEGTEKYDNDPRYRCVDTKRTFVKWCPQCNAPMEKTTAICYRDLTIGEIIEVEVNTNECGCSDCGYTEDID